MINRLFILLLILLSLHGYGQFIPNSSQNFQFMSAYNPSFTGVDAFTDIKLGYRNQWIGLSSPITYFNLSFNTRLKQPINLIDNSLRTGREDIKTLNNSLPKKKKAIIGFGANVFQEKVGAVNRFGGLANFSFHYPVFEKSYLSLGVGVSMDNTRINLNEITLRDQDPFYQQLVNEGESQLGFNTRASLLFYSKKFYLGFSYFPVLNSILTSSELDFVGSYYLASGQVGMSFPIGSGVSIRPSIFALFTADHSLQLEYDIKTYFQQKLWFGIGYDDIGAGRLLFGFDVNSTFGFSYSYETSTNGLQQFNNGSHELILLLRLVNLKKERGFVW